MRRGYLEPQFVRPADGLREWLTYVLALAHGETVVVVHGFDPHRHAKATGISHFLHEGTVAELVKRHHRDKTPLLPAQQGEHLGSVAPIGQEVVVRELQVRGWVEFLQLIDLLFEHLQRLGPKRPHEA